MKSIIRCIATALAWSVCALALAMSGCAGANMWFACELGKLPQTAQVLIPSVIQALEQQSESSALAALQAIGAGLAPGQLECIVQAIAADTQRKMAGPRVNASTIQGNARAYRDKHPARLKCDK